MSYVNVGEGDVTAADVEAATKLVDQALKTADELAKAGAKFFQPPKKKKKKKKTRETSSSTPPREEAQLPAQLSAQLPPSSRISPLVVLGGLAAVGVGAVLLMRMRR